MKYFFAGIKGSGMSALASMLYDMGDEIIGYDDSDIYSFTEEELNKRNIKIYIKDSKKLTKDMILVYTSAIHDDHEVVVKANELGIKKYEYFEMLGKLTKKLTSICISGCHGKTTTTALLSKIFIDTKGCNYLIGDGRGYVDKKSDFFILESCEYKRHFLAYYPDYAIITNIEMDHVDYYKDMDDMLLAYQQFADKVEKKLIACGDDSYVRKIKSDKIMYYGFNDDNDIVAKNVKLSDDGSSFDVYIDKKLYSHFDLPLFGKHMVLNCLACIGICYLENISKEEIIKSVHTFKGAKRRFKETKIKNNILIDDYAHHPTEVKVTLLAARQKYPDKELVAVLKIHTSSRAQALWKEFVEALKIADKAYVMDIYNDRENPDDYPGVNADLLIKNIPSAEHIGDHEAEKLLKHKDAVICFLSSKDVNTIQTEYKKLLGE